MCLCLMFELTKFLHDLNSGTGKSLKIPGEYSLSWYKDYNTRLTFVISHWNDTFMDYDSVYAAITYLRGYRGDFSWYD